MKRRFKALFALSLALVLVLGIFEPLSASAQKVANEVGASFIQYAKPGDTLNYKRGSSVPATITYMKYGTKVSEVGDSTKVFNGKSKLSYCSIFGEDPACKAELYDFYDSFLGYEEEGLTDWLIVASNSSYETADLYAIPLKATDSKPAYVQDVYYTAKDENVTFSINTENISELEGRPGDFKYIHCMWFRYEYAHGNASETNKYLKITQDKVVDGENAYFELKDGKYQLKGIAGPDDQLNGPKSSAIGGKINVDYSTNTPDYLIFGIDYSLTSEEPVNVKLIMENGELSGGYDLIVGGTSGEANGIEYFGLGDSTGGSKMISFSLAITDPATGKCAADKVKGHFNLSFEYEYERNEEISEDLNLSVHDSITIPINEIKSYPDAEYYAVIGGPDNWKKYILTNCAKAVLESYTISSQASHGKISVPKEAAVGETVTVELTPDKGYKADGIEVKTESGSKISTKKISDTKYTFEMPKGKVKVTGSFVVASNSVKVTTVNNVTVKADKTKAQAGEKVTVTATPKDGYKVTAISVKDASGKAITVKKNSSGKYYFTMPSSAVTVKATVKADPYIKLGASKLSMSKGQTFSLSKVTTTVAPYDKVASYKSSKASVVAVDSKGKLTAKATGSAAITITTKKGAKGKIPVNVGSKAITTTKVKVTNVENGKLMLKKGKTFKTETAVTPITSQDKLSFASNKATVASVDSKGKITAKKAGKATITVTSGKQKATFVVTVK